MAKVFRETIILLLMGHPIVAFAMVDPQTPTNAQPASGGIGWGLVWTDEFNGVSLDTSRWQKLVSTKSRAARPTQGIDDWWWKSENTFLDGFGNLILEVIKHDYNTMYCGSVNTNNLYEPTYGYFETRIQIADTSKGTHTAFWFQGDNMSNVDGTANDGAEIDVFESAWFGDYTKSVVHIDGYGSSHQANTKQWNAPGIHSGYHTYGIEWTHDYLKIYYDGVLKTQYTDSKWIPRVPEYIWLSDGASFGDISTFIDEPVGYLTEARVDYVRVWQKDYSGPPEIPTGLATTPSDGLVSLNWDDNTEPDLMHYNVYRSTTSGSGYVSIYSGQTTSDYVDNSVSNGTTYYYVVTAVDTSNNESGYSSEVLAVFTPGAETITVENYSFELPGIGKLKCWDGEGSGGLPPVDVPGWSSDTTAVDSGVEDTYGGSDGTWRGFLMNTDPAVWNLTSHVLGTGETITLMVDATGSSRALTMSIYYDDSGSRVVVATGTVTTSSTWQTHTLMLFADDVPAAVGHQIGILFRNATAGTTNTWLGIDNVRLDVATEPVPGDLTGDGKVDMEDMAELGKQWQEGYDMNTLLDIASNWLYGVSI